MTPFFFFGIPPENVENANFIDTATLKEGGRFVVRRAPPPDGAVEGGGAYEVVVEPGSAELESSLEW